MPRQRRVGVAKDARDAGIDRWVWYAGWTDELAAVLGGANPVAGPYFDLSLPEQTGVVAVLAPQPSSLLGLVSVLAPVLAGCSPPRGARPASTTERGVPQHHQLAVSSLVRATEAVLQAPPLVASDLPHRAVIT